VKTTLFYSGSIDGYIANSDGIPMFPPPAWEVWCELVNEVGNCIAGRASVESLKDQEMAKILNPDHKIVLSTRDIDFSDAGWELAKSPAEALAMLEAKGVEEAIVGGGRAIYHAFMREELVDEIVLDLQPIAFGQGVPVFGDVLTPALLKLVDSSPLNDSAMRLRYEVVREG